MGYQEIWGEVERLLEQKGGSAIRFTTPSIDGFDFNKHYLNNRDRILKLEATAGGTGFEDEDTTTLWFAKFGTTGCDLNQAEGTLSVPFYTLRRLGYRKGETIRHFTIFIEVIGNNRINIYVTNKKGKQLRNSRYREIEKEVAQTFAGYKDEDDY